MVVPFVTWPFQDDFFTRCLDAIFRLDPWTEKIGRDLEAMKARDMGLTWITGTTIDYVYRFVDYSSALMATRKEELVDDPGNPDTLFWKLDFIEEHLPRWLQIPDRVRTSRHLENPLRHSTIDGESTNKDLAVGGRKTVIFLDEAARLPNADAIYLGTADVTNCRISVSTPEGPNTAFARKIKREGANVVYLHWSLHPEKARGLYTVSDDGDVTLLDKKFWIPSRVQKYKFVHRQPKSKKYKFRSPWYDVECARRGEGTVRGDLEIARNLDLDEEGSQPLFFDAQIIARLHTLCRDPISVGELEYEKDIAQPIRWHEGKSAHAKLWFVIADGGAPPPSPYGIGCDLSQGRGASNSVLSVWNCRTREKVFELADAHIRPERFAEIAVSYCRWFADANGNPAMLAWEKNGPGNTFGDRVLELNFYNVFRRKTETSMGGVKFSDTPGWEPTRKNMYQLVDLYRKALESGNVTNVHATALEECLEYVKYGDGWVDHSASLAVDEDDQTGAKNTHGDRVIADALAVMLATQDRKVEVAHKSVDVSAPPPVYSFGWRMERALKELVTPEY